MTLTLAQFDALERIKRLQARREKKFEEECARLEQDFGQPITLSPWLFIAELVGIRQATIKCLISKGYLESRPGDGWGTEYKLTEKARVGTRHIG